MENNISLKDFLVKAKINTYAGDGVANKLSDGSKELNYKEGIWKYKDKYFGFDPFAGQEVVFKNGKLVWMMDYYGNTFSDDITAKEIYTFLKKAMLKVSQDKPFRGPDIFQEGNFEYICKSEGSVDDFLGFEEIYFNNNKVYKLNYHGGKI